MARTAEFAAPLLFGAIIGLLVGCIVVISVTLQQIERLPRPSMRTQQLIHIDTDPPTGGGKI